MLSRCGSSWIFSGEDIDTIECDSFPALMDALSLDASLLGIMAIENTIAGALLQNHELLRMGHALIIGEYKMRISHSLAALPGQDIDELTEVNSHPMALRQCEQFLLRYPAMKRIEKFDTAGAAREIAENKLTGHAAVCGEYAARLYGLNVLASGIETNKRNFRGFSFWPIHWLLPTLSRAKRYRQIVDSIHASAFKRRFVKSPYNIVVLRYQPFKDTVNANNRS